MRVGSVCYATSRGLGHLCKDFYDNGVITDVFVIRHNRVPTNDHWYPNAPEAPLGDLYGRGNLERAKEFARSVEAMLFFETPFYQELMPFCKEHGIRTYLVTMYECTTESHRPPHRYLCPSLLDHDYFALDGPSARPGLFEHDRRGKGGAWCSLVQLPVDARVVWKQKERALHYVHNGGYLGLRGSDGVRREGTATVINAMRYVRSPLLLSIRVQENVSPELQRLAAADSRVVYTAETLPYEELYGAGNTGDVAVGAQKWNGCSLPLQEAYASGMLVMNTDRYPMNTWLPRAPLVNAKEYRRFSIGGPYMKFDEAVVDPVLLAVKMDEYYGADLTDYSLQARAWGEANGWEALRPCWQEILSV